MPDQLHTPARRRFLQRAWMGAGALVLAGCDRLSTSEWFGRLLGSAERVNIATAHAARNAMAQEFAPADLSPSFRSNGTAEPDSADYRALMQSGFLGYRLVVDGLVQRPGSFSLDQLKALPARTQITRHDCVEGWSAIGKWQGARLRAVLDAVQPRPEARFLVFHCADPMEQEGKEPYYESIDMEDAYHEQTILAYALNDAPLPVQNGAPIRLRVERQLGYKHAKYVMRIELVDSFAKLRGGRGGYWEDRGYAWYAGI